jgi:hypothetical protein
MSPWTECTNPVMGTEIWGFNMPKHPTVQALIHFRTAISPVLLDGKLPPRGKQISKPVDLVPPIEWQDAPLSTPYKFSMTSTIDLEVGPDHPE